MSPGIPSGCRGPADIGVVAATAIEVGPFLARLTTVRKYAGPSTP